MIPETNKQLLVTQDWKKIYKSFRNADFKSYDFETLRRTMISYLQENYPEDFNDFIDSSEYIALIDLIAYLGQNLSFRIDLNARENFLETAQRRDSILRLAQLISYNPKRNVPGNGFLKVTAIATTDNIIDSNGVNLANTTIAWNDNTNPDWYQQFVNILNAATTSKFGNPLDRKTINGVLTEQYKFSSITEDVPIFGFSKSINGVQMNFEVVPCTFADNEVVYETPPKPGDLFSFIYKNDNQGSSSPNTGFFTHFRQGVLGVANFTIDNPVPNEIVGVNTPDINDTDIWLWQRDKNGEFSVLWDQVPSTSKTNNVIYNSLDKDLRNIYAITSRENDQIDLNFADGIFGNLPKGDFRLLYRQSNGKVYVIKPEQLSGIIIQIPYLNPQGQIHTLSVTLSLQYTVNNSSGAESNASIQLKAPQQYYIQNRMITGEDYNIAPLNAGSDILKVKSINRISSGVSKYFDISDVSGAYSKTNIFANDGILYKEVSEDSFEFEFSNRNQVLEIVKNRLAPIIRLPSLKSFYLDQFENFDFSELGLEWVEVNKTPGQSRGYFKNVNGVLSVGEYSQEQVKYIIPGALVKFIAPTGKYFDAKNNLKVGATVPQGGKSYIWSRVQQVIGDGGNSGMGTLDDGTGPIIFGSRVPQGAIPVEVAPKYPNILSFSLETEIVNLCLTQRNFGITINNSTRDWELILNTNLDLLNTFSLVNQGSVDDAGIDASWLVAFVWTGKQYIVRYRQVDYIFESEKETAFYFDNTDVNYDYVDKSIVKDSITILSVNTLGNGSLGSDQKWQIDSPVVEPDGYIQPKKVKVSFYDFNNTGQIDDPESFDHIVSPLTTSTTTGFRENFVYFQRLSDGQRYKLIDKDDFYAYPTEDVVDPLLKTDGQKFYFYDPSIDVVKYWSTSTSKLEYTDSYFARTGRYGLKFQYVHNSGKERRLDPSKTNIIDIYLLTTNYDSDFRNFLLENVSQEPLSPTSQELEQNYKSYLVDIKAISDEIVFHPVKYKTLFGKSADSALQGKFKAVKNSQNPISDNDLKTRILTSINNFFALENWDFGQTFYFSELATYVMNEMTPDITNFVIVPKNDKTFGSLFEVSCLSNEIFISSASIEDIEIIDAVTASQLKASSV